MGWDELYLGHGAWLHCSLVKHRPESERETLKLLGGGYFFLWVFFFFFFLREQLKDSYTRAPGFVIKITKLPSTKVNHKLTESSHFLWEWRGFLDWIFSFNLFKIFLCLFCMA